MSMIPDEIIEQVRDSADLVGVIGESVDLRRTGADYRGPCPFHGGTHRNFAVIPRKGLFYCYVCHAAGDIFSYFMKRFGMDYPSAVREVARRSGIVIPEQTSRAGPDPREPLFSAVSVAQEWYALQLRESREAEPARRYLAGRGFSPEAAQPLGLGYAPPGPAFLAEMGKHEIPEAILLEAGLVFRRDDGSLVPRFRGRLLIPIHDLRGRVVGFGGRILGPGEPKYLNSPETPIFHKGSLLYNLHQARHPVRKAELAIVVEGYFDVLALVQAGIENVVAPLGTALTGDQAALLRRFAPAAALMFDSDSAGQRATFRTADELLRHEVRVRVATLPPGQDPDTVVREAGAAAIEKLVEDAVDVLERKIQLLERKGWFSGMEHRRDALDRLLPTVRAAHDSITRELYLGLIAERTGVSRRVLEEELARNTRNAPPAAEAAAPERRERAAPPARPRAGAHAEREVLRVVMHYDGWLERARNDIPPEWIEGPAAREVYTALLDAGPDLAAERLESLSEPARALWEALTVPSGLEERQAGDSYEAARQMLEARPHFRQYYRLSRQLRIAAGEEKDALFVQKNAMRQDLRRRFPGAFDRFMMRRHSGRRAQG